MNPSRSTFRLQFLLGFLACCGMMAYAFYSQLVLHLNPCNLCVFQRIATIALGTVFLLGALTGPTSRGGKIIWSLIATLMAGAGMVVAGRHLWIQSLPADQVPSCGAPLHDLVQMMSWSKVFVKVFNGSGECAVINWRFLGLAMPAWVLICFVVLALWALYAGFRSKR